MSVGRSLTVVLAVGLIVVLVIATRPPSPDEMTSTTTGADDEESLEPFDPDPSLQALPGRLLVVDEEDGIATMNADGTERVTIARPDSSIEERSLPTWSSSADRIAWTELWDDGHSDLVVATGSGETVSRLKAPFLASYVAWDPTGTLIALSGDDGRSSLVLYVADLRSREMTRLAEGAPLYFDWHPEGDELLVHHGNRLEHIPADGSQGIPLSGDGEFRVPIHFDGSLVLGSGREVGEALYVGNTGGDVLVELLRYATPMAFVADPGQRRLAVLSKGSPANQALSRLTDFTLPILEPNNLTVVDRETGVLELIAEGQGVAWSFSPEGGSLLYSTLVTVDAAQRLQWNVWDGRTSVTFASFSPAGRFGREYLAFFDQFDRTTTLWSPDGSAFVYAGGTSLENAGVWVQPIDSEDPIRVAVGVAAFWSPGA